MLLRRRAPGIQTRPADTTKGFAHLDPGAVAVLRCLTANQVDFVLVGRVAEAVRGRADARGPVAVVTAPYGRNFARLERALAAAHARQRFDTAPEGDPETLPVNLTAEKLARGHRWTLRLDGGYDLDLEPLPAAGRGADEHAPGYQELLYESTRFELAEDVTVEVASPEDIEHYAHLARTGQPPHMRVSRAVPVGHAH
jgi:hypothetical protein